MPTRDRALRSLIHLAVAAAPAILTLLLTREQLGAGVGDFVPSFWNDQVGYWHRIASFSNVGFGFGYYSPGEVAMPVDAIRFGVNGPWFPTFYGSFAALFGWTAWSSIPFNMVAVGLGLTIFLVLVRASVRTALLAALAVCTLWPVLLYIPTASQESLQQSIAMALAGIFVRAIARGRSLSTREKMLSIAFVIVATLFRFSWGIVLPWLLALYLPRPTRRSVGTAIVAGAVVTAIAVKVSGMFQPAGNNSVTDTFDKVRHDPFTGSWDVVQLVADNLRTFLYPDARSTMDPTAVVPSSASIDITNLQSWIIVGLVVLAILAIVAALTRSPRLPRVLRDIPVRESGFHFINLGLMTLAALALYLPFGFYRVLGAHLLLSVLVLIGLHRWRPVLLIAALNLLLAPSFLAAYDRWAPNFHLDQQVIAQSKRLVSQHVRYEHGARNPWCNTILMPVSVYDWRVTVIPPGLGISYGGVENQTAIPKSRYVLLPSDFTETIPGLRKLVTTPAGTFYENPGSACFEGANR
jgi:hypothetical protein